MSMAGTPIGKTVLLVEDDNWLRNIMAELLADDGYHVRQAATGTQAMEQVEHEVPDLIVLDLNLPEMSGLDVLHEIRIRKHLLKLPVIVMSGSLDGETRRRLSHLAERADDVFEKPVDVGRLFERLERATVG